jgi:hypothetical protein
MALRELMVNGTEEERAAGMGGFGGRLIPVDFWRKAGTWGMLQLFCFDK